MQFQFVLLLCVLLTCNACTSFWSYNVDYPYYEGPPTFRNSFSAVSFSDPAAIYMMGGVDSTGVAYSDVWVYTPETGSWDEYRTSSYQRYGHSSVQVAIGSSFGLPHLYMLSYGNKASYDTSIDYFNINSTAKPRVIPSCGPSARYYLQAGSFDDTMIIFGGTEYSSGVSLDDTWAFNASSVTWTQFFPTVSPPPRYGACSGWNAFYGLFFVFGGANFNGSTTTYYDDLWVYSVQNNTWTQLSTSGGPGARVHANSLSTELGLIIVTGGLSSNGTALADSYSYDLRSNLWTKMTAVTARPRVLAASAYIWDCPDRQFIFGDTNGTFIGKNTTYPGVDVMIIV